MTNMSGWSGVSELHAATAHLVETLTVASREIVSVLAAKTEAGAKANFSGTHAKGQPHVGGSQPNIVSGNARRQIMTDPVKGYGFGVFAASVAPTAVYSRRLELGINGTGAYPFFTPAVNATRKEAVAVAYKIWATALKL